MATGLSNQCTKQAGEHFVAAELARQGFLVATFAGNVPEFDIVAVKDSRRHLIQVKTANEKVGSWMLDPRKFLDIALVGEAQHFKGSKGKPTYEDIVYVFVWLGTTRGGDELYALRWDQLQEVVKRTYFNEGPVKKRPRKPESFHFVVKRGDLEDYLVAPEARLLS